MSGNYSMMSVDQATLDALRQFFLKNRAPEGGFTPAWIAAFCGTSPVATLVGLAYLLEAGEIQTEVSAGGLAWTFSRRAMPIAGMGGGQ